MDDFGSGDAVLTLSHFRAFDRSLIPSKLATAGCLTPETDMPQETFSKNVTEGCRPRVHQDPEMEIESLRSEVKTLRTQLEKLMNSRETAEQSKKEISVLETGFANSSEALKVAPGRKAAADVRRDEFAKVLEDVAMYEENYKYVVLGELASEIEDHMKDLVLAILPKKRRKAYHYKDGSKKFEMIDRMHYLDELKANQELQTEFVRVNFSGQQIQFSEFNETMEALKEVFRRNDWGEVLRCPMADLTVADLESMIDGADLESKHKERLKSYAAWIQSPSKK